MPSPSTVKQLLALPFRTGLSQKEDPRWLEPGALLTAQNTVHSKTNTAQKRTGYTALSRGFAPLNPFTGAVSIQAGKRLGTDGNRLLAVATDAWTDAAFTYDEKSGQWIYLDRVPEAYAMPDRTIAAADSTIREFDTAVSNGYAVHVWLDSTLVPFSGAPGTNSTGRVMYKVENAATGETVVAPQLVPFQVHGQDAGGVKIIANGTKVVLGFVFTTAGSANLTLGLYTLDCTAPWTGWFGPTSIGGLVNPQNAAQIGAWDIAPDGPTGFVVVYQVAGRPNTLEMSVGASTTPPTILTTTNLNGADAQYVADNPTVVAFGLDVTGTLAGIAYAYQSASSLAVHVSQYSLQTLVSTATAVDLMSQPGPLHASVTGAPSPAPNTIQISSITTASFPTYSSPYRVCWSPSNSEWDAEHSDGFGGNATAFTAIWTTAVTTGHMAILGNSPRVTWGVAAASRWLGNVNGIGYILGRLPSWEQGTYFLFADDAWQDVLSPNSGGGSSANTWFPLRLVATFAPRLSSFVFTNALAPGSAAHAVALQDQYLPHAVPHLALNPGAAGTSVYQTLISVSSTVQNQNPTLIQWDMESTLSYQNCCLGQNTGIATGTPSLTDGTRVHEFAFPYYPSITQIKNVGTTNPGLSQGTYSWIAIYDWVDARGQLHRSARSGAQTIQVGPGPGQAVSLTVTTMGFSGKEKAVLAVNATGSPQSNGSNFTPITVRFFRTQVNGLIFYEVAAFQNTQGSPTLTYVDSLADTTIATNTLLYGDGLDGVQQGSILDHLCPPAFQCMCVHQNRWFGVDGNNVWASGELVNGEGLGFHELQAFSWDDGTGPITAIASLGDKLLLYRNDSIAYVTGQGPQDDGGQNDWSPPIGIATDTGCTDWRSVVVKHDGVYFDSPAGRRMIGFDLVVQAVPDVEDTLQANPVTTSAVLHPTAGRILTTNNVDDVSSPRSGVIVIRDYVLESWMTAVHANGNGAVSAVVADAPQSGGLVPTYHWMDATGVVWRETPSAYFDGGATYVPLQLETAWVKADGIQGFARFRRLQLVWQNLDAHQLSVFVAFDYSSTYYLMGTVTAAMMSAMASPLCQQLFALPRQRAEAVRFKIIDAADASTAPTTGQGPLLISMGLEVTRYTNARTNRLPAAQRS